MARADLRIHTEACCLSPWNKVILGYLRGKTKWINANLKTVTVHDKCNFPWKTSWFWNFKDPNQTVHDSLYHGDFTALEQLFCGQLVYWHSVMPGLFSKITQKTIVRNVKHANSVCGLSIQNLGTCMRRYESMFELSHPGGIPVVLFEFDPSLRFRKKTPQTRIGNGGTPHQMSSWSCDFVV